MLLDRLHSNIMAGRVTCLQVSHFFHLFALVMDMTMFERDVVSHCWVT